MHSLHIRLALTFPVATILLACGSTPPGSTGHCLVGSQVTIPTTDSTPPSVAIDFHMPGGSIVSRSPGDGLSSRIAVPMNGQVSIYAVTRDAQGVRDSRIFAATKSCSEDLSTNLGSCSGPGLLGGPTASNPESNSAGSPGCTERLVIQKVTVSKTTTAARSSSVSVEASAEGVNFGGQAQRTTTYVLER
jgi:hypothetical protein